MQRYFLRNELIFDEEDKHHILRVMRMKKGDRIEAVLDSKVYLLEITNTLPFEYTIIEEYTEDKELNITLLYCLPKGEKLELVVQKATELGVKEIILVQSSRCVVKYKQNDFEKKLNRLNKIALEAAEQSKRNTLPIIKDIIDYKKINSYKFDHAFIAYEKENDKSLYEKLSEIKNGQSIAFLVGAEGGFSLEEVEYAIESGYNSISLGKRILRSETAAIFCMSVAALVSER